MARAANMQALTNDVKREYPGLVVYGIGDDAHKARKSGHNEDDTPGSLPELQDADNRPEHRAIDIMIGAAFTKADADALVSRLIADPRARARLYYVIWHGHIWSRSSGWVRKTYTGGDQHTDHVHLSGWAADDENTASWPAVAKEGPDMTKEEHDTLMAVKAMLTDPDGRETIGMLYKRLAVGKDDRPDAVPVDHPTLTSLADQLRKLAERPPVAVDYDQLADALLRRVLSAGTTTQS